MNKVLIYSIVLLIVSGCNLALPVVANDSVNLVPDEASSGQVLMDFNIRPGIAASVLLQETQLLVQTSGGGPVRVGQLDSRLLNEWGHLYLRVNDYDRDGWQDLAIMTSAGRGQYSQRCYAIYRYNPVSRQFRQRKSFDRCGI